MLLLFQVTSPPGARHEFHWDWHDVQSPFSTGSLKDAKIAESERTVLAEAIEAQFAPNPYDPEMASEVQVKRAALNANITMIRLSQDEKESPEIVASVERFCSADGNCPLRFLRRTARGYRLLLDATGEGFTVQKTATNGFSDLVVNMHSSATDQWLKVYRYSQGRYRRVACYDANWAPLENGEVHELKEPRITPSTCN